MSAEANKMPGEAEESTVINYLSSARNTDDCNNKCNEIGY